MEVYEEPPTKIPRQDSDLESCSAVSRKLKKDKNRRRSSLCAKRISLKGPFSHSENPTNCSSDISSESGTSFNTEVPPKLDKCAKLEKEMLRLTEESADWEARLKDSEAAALSAQQLASEFHQLDIGDLPLQVKLRAQDLIGEIPNYAAILEQMYQKMTKVKLMVEKIELFTEACERRAKKSELTLNNLAESLDEQSIYAVDSPRTLINKRIAVPTPR